MSIGLKIMTPTALQILPVLRSRHLETGVTITICVDVMTVGELLLSLPVLERLKESLWRLFNYIHSVFFHNDFRQFQSFLIKPMQSASLFSTDAPWKFAVPCLHSLFHAFNVLSLKRDPKAPLPISQAITWCRR